MINKLLHKYIHFHKNHSIIFLIGILVMIPLSIILIAKFTLQYKPNDIADRSVKASETVLTEGQDTISQPVIFRDSLGSIELDVQLTPSQSDYGKFHIYLPQRGYYSGIIPILQIGEQVVHPQGSVKAQFYSLNGSSPILVTIRMEGEINIDHSTAAINIWINNTHYHLETAQGNVADATKVAKQELEYTASKNWPALYGLYASSFQVTTSQVQFFHTMSDDTGLPTVLSSNFTSPGQIKNLTGYSYFLQPVTLTIHQTGGIVTTAHETDIFVLEQGQWRFLTTTTPVSP